MSNTQNLWGELPTVEAIRLPVVILREQAAKLTEITGGLLQGEVTTKKTQAALRHNLLIIAPALDNYSFNVLTILHGVVAYPIEINGSANNSYYQCDNEDEFIGVISRILSSPEVHRTIGALLAQSKAEDQII